MDCIVQLIAQLKGGKSAPPTSLTLPPQRELIYRTRRQFRGVGELTEVRTLGISAPLTLPYHTETLVLASDPLASALAFYTPLMTMNTLPPIMTIPVRKQLHPFRTRSRLVCTPSLDPLSLRRQQPFVLRKALPRLLLQRSFRPILWTQIMPFLREKKTPPTHHGQAAERPQHKCITLMPLLT